MVFGLTPAFTRNKLSFFFCDEAAHWHQVKRVQTPILRAFLKPYLEESLKRLTGNQSSVDLLEHWRYVEPLHQWELCDRWWLLYLLTERGADLPLYESPQEVSFSADQPAQRDIQS